MTKQAMLWLIGIVVIAFFYIAAVNVDETHAHITGSGFGSSISTDCQGMWNPAEWFDDSCDDSLPSRLGVMALGVMGLIVCVYVAEKAKPAPQAIRLAANTSSRVP